MHIAVLGATGVVGQEILSVLEQRDFPVTSLAPLASARSAGRTVPFRGKRVEVKPAGAESFYGIDLVLASAGATVTRELAPVIRKSGAILIDNSSAFRMDPDTPLVVPEGAVVVPGARAVTQGMGPQWGLSLSTPVIVKYRDEKTDARTNLEQWVR